MKARRVWSQWLRKDCVVVRGRKKVRRRRRRRRRRNDALHLVTGARAAVLRKICSDWGHGSAFVEARNARGAFGGDGENSSCSTNAYQKKKEGAPEQHL